MWHQYVAQNFDMPARTFDGETLVITPGTSSLHTLNDTATFIWEQADGSTTLEEILQAVLHAFDVTAEAARTQTLAFIEHATSVGLLVTSDEPVSP